MHEQEVVAVVFQSEVITDTCTHRHCRYTGITDERIKLLVLGQEEVSSANDPYMSTCMMGIISCNIDFRPIVARVLASMMAILGDTFIMRN